jgi:predicted ATPase with chaperone activity
VAVWNGGSSKLEFRRGNAGPVAKRLRKVWDNMSKGNDLGLLDLLKKKGNTAEALAALAAKSPAHEPGDGNTPAAEAKLNEVLSRINQLTGAELRRGEAAENEAAAASSPSAAASGAAAKLVSSGAALGGDEFIPSDPPSIREAGLTDSEVESLALKYLLSRGDAAGREIADQVKLPFILLEPLLRQLKYDQLVIYRAGAPANDYVYQLTDLGRERARRFMDHCTYFGSAPVALSDYIASIKAQTLERQHPSPDDLKRAFEDILVSERMLRRLGPAINSGRGLFLYGAAGNGKTTIAERITRSFGQFIWIPRAIGIDGEIIRLFDPVNHEECPLPANAGLLDQSKIDRRWVRIRRPTIVVGGELTMDSLEVTLNRSTGISEAPLQLKSNCGTLVIDDFGRQKMGTDTLLNRWIVPLEKRFDFLNLPNGKKIQVPFDQLIVFSTNLEPKDLVDEAFLRRIPYKIEIIDPTEQEFKDLFKLMCGRLGFQYEETPVNYLIENHYKKNRRNFRCCHPRDLLLQVKNYCLFRKTPLKLSNENFDLAVENYFAVM